MFTWFRGRLYQIESLKLTLVLGLESAIACLIVRVARTMVEEPTFAEKLMWPVLPMIALVHPVEPASGCAS